MPDLASEICFVFQDAIKAEFGDEYSDFDPIVRKSDRADLQANFDLGLTKKVGKPPREVAEAVIGRIKNDIFAELEVAGPGFVNIKIT